MKVKQHEKYGAVVLEFKGNVMGGPEAQEFSDLLHDLLKQEKKKELLKRDLIGLYFFQIGWPVHGIQQKQ